MRACVSRRAARDLLGLLDEVFDELAGPQAAAEMLGDQRALRVVFVPGRRELVPV